MWFQYCRNLNAMHLKQLTCPHHSLDSSSISQNRKSSYIHSQTRSMTRMISCRQAVTILQMQGMEQMLASRWHDLVISHLKSTVGSYEHHYHSFARLIFQSSLKWWRSKSKGKDLEGIQWISRFPSLNIDENVHWKTKPANGMSY